jgi:hypothetical protein
VLRVTFSPTIAVAGSIEIDPADNEGDAGQAEEGEGQRPQQAKPVANGPGNAPHPLDTSTAVSDVTTLTAGQDFVIVRKKYVSSTMPGL